jgi:hypothetical protein
MPQFADFQGITMDSETKTVVTFESTACNMAKPKDYFINPCCFGDATSQKCTRSCA